MSILADTVYKLFCSQITGFKECKSEKIFRFFIKNYVNFDITSEGQGRIRITLNKKVHLPLLYETDWFKRKTKIPWLGNYKLKFEIGSSL